MVVRIDPIYGYSVRNSYRFITTSGEQVDRSLVDDVWHKNVPAKVSLFVWCLLRNKLPTKDNLPRRSILSPNEVVRSARCGNSETANHLFLQCDILVGV